MVLSVRRTQLDTQSNTVGILSTDVELKSKSLSSHRKVLLKGYTVTIKKTKQDSRLRLLEHMDISTRR